MTKTNHTGHDHPATPAARAACRKAETARLRSTGATRVGQYLQRKAREAAIKATQPKTGRDEAAGVWRWCDGSTSPLETKFSAGENGVPK